MSALLRRATERIRWKPERECRRLRGDPEATADCICRAYDGAGGYYVIVDGHARGYALERKEALRIAEPRGGGA